MDSVKEGSGSIITGLIVTNSADGSTSPLTGINVLGSYPSGFGMRSEVSDPSLVNSMQFKASNDQK